MTRKDYVAIAAVIANARLPNGAGPFITREAAETHAACRGFIGRALAGVMAQGNPRFDRERFLKACGVQS